MYLDVFFSVFSLIIFDSMLEDKNHRVSESIFDDNVEYCRSYWLKFVY